MRYFYRPGRLCPWNELSYELWVKYIARPCEGETFAEVPAELVE